MQTFSGSGLSQKEVDALRKKYGWNELASAGKKPLWKMALGVAAEPMFILLVACALLYLLIGDVGEGLLLLGSVSVVGFITLYQERRTERAIEALKDMSSPRALVIRDGKEIRIAGREVLPGDIMIIQEGDRVAADGELLETVNFRVDESLLTGESVPVRKSTDGEHPDKEVYAGTLSVAGHGIARVTAIGQQTRFGKIGQLLTTVEVEQTLLKKETTRLVKIFSIAGVSVCSILFLIYGLLRGEWINGLLAGLSLAMAMLPEEFPVVLTIFMALGAWRMSANRVLARRHAAIETLGAVTVLCSDKTGTLTENRMTVRALVAGTQFLTLKSNDQDLPEEFHALVEYAILASQKKPFDPMEKAFLRLGELKLANTEHLHEDWIMEREYPLSSKLLAISHVYRNPDSAASHVIATKGSPEAIADLCHLPEAKLNEIREQVFRLASQGLRVLGVARSLFTRSELPADQHEFDFEWIGLIGLEDPLRQSIRSDLTTCYGAGVRVVMITGDYPVTAQHIARDMGLHNADKVLAGSDMVQLSEEEFRKQVKEVNIFARVSPEQKLRIVEALKANGEIVAMTGDGVNDAPSLKSAHIGIAMGERGTDVAREAAALVLLDDNFSSITGAIRMGRRIYDNIRNAMAYILSVHLPIAGLTLIPALLNNMPAVLFPLHIAFLELIIDPACTLIFEAEKEENDIMLRKPRRATDHVFSRSRVLLSVLQGVSVLAVSLAVYFGADYLGRSDEEIRTLTFTALIISNVGLILVNRSWSRTVIETFQSPNPSVRWVTGGIVVLLLLVLYVPFLANAFHFTHLSITDWLVCLVLGILSILWFEWIKVIRRKQLT